jgi:hypothetical protein
MRILLFSLLVSLLAFGQEPSLSLSDEIYIIRTKMIDEPLKAEHHLRLASRLAKRHSGDDVIEAKKEYQRFLEMADRRDPNIPRVQAILDEAKNQNLDGVKTVQVWTIDELQTLIKTDSKNPDFHMKLGSLFAKRGAQMNSNDDVKMARKHYGLFLKHAPKTHAKYQAVKDIIEADKKNAQMK